MRESTEKKEEKNRGRDLYEWVQALVCSVLAVVILFQPELRRMLDLRHPADRRGRPFHGAHAAGRGPAAGPELPSV